MAHTTRRLLDLAHVAPGSRVLAIGVGTGGEALEAARRVGPDGQVVATDLSAAMIEEARKAAAEAGLRNIEFRVMDGQRLDFQPASFDVVTSRNVLMFIPDLRSALIGMRRVLRRSGRIGATVWSTGVANPRISGPLAALRAYGIRPPDSATYRIALRLGRPSLLRSHFTEAGFTDVAVERVSLDTSYASLEEAVNLEMELPATRELIGLLGGDGEMRMHRSITRRWGKYAVRSGVHLPGEQLVAAGTA
jgi:SAM-dependent methyltransferase